jgi:hypothetical protein
MPSKKPLKVTDKRRQTKAANLDTAATDTNGAGPALADIFSDRRKYQNGKGRKVS